MRLEKNVNQRSFQVPNCVACGFERLVSELSNRLVFACFSIQRVFGFLRLQSL